MLQMRNICKGLKPKSGLSFSLIHNTFKITNTVFCYLQIIKFQVSRESVIAFHLFVSLFLSSLPLLSCSSKSEVQLYNI
jgi:hypothetical protein